MTIRLVPPHKDPIIGPDGRMSQSWASHHDAVAKAATGALTAAQAEETVINGRLINAGAGLQGGGDLSQDRFVSLYKFTGPVAKLPTTGNTSGDWALATDACNATETTGNGTGCPVVWSVAASAWRIPGIAAAVSA